VLFSGKTETISMGLVLIAPPGGKLSLCGGENASQIDEDNVQDADILTAFRFLRQAGDVTPGLERFTQSWRAHVLALPTRRALAQPRGPCDDR